MSKATAAAQLTNLRHPSYYANPRGLPHYHQKLDHALKPGILAFAIKRINQTGNCKMIKLTLSKIVGLTLAISPLFLQAAYYEDSRPPQPDTLKNYPSEWRNIADWQGFYAGLNGGWAHGHTKANTSATPGLGFDSQYTPDINTAGAQTLNSDAFTYGVLGGYNLQFSHVVMGLEASFGGMNLSSAQTTNARYNVTSNNFHITQSVTTDWLFTARYRLGYTAGHLLTYASAGYALTNIHYFSSYPSSYSAVNNSAHINSNLSGWLAGAGMEYQLAQHWSIRGEYHYLGFQDAERSGPDAAGDVWTIKARLSAQLLNFSVNYLF
jgi:opacity protein-like surface antigen